MVSESKQKFLLKSCKYALMLHEYMSKNDSICYLFIAKLQNFLIAPRRSQIHAQVCTRLLTLPSSSPAPSTPADARDFHHSALRRTMSDAVAVTDRRLRLGCCHLWSYFKHTPFSCCCICRDITCKAASTMSLIFNTPTAA